MTLNRHARRSLARTLERDPAAARGRPASVALAGGPMDGWVVKPDAPALRPNWHTTWPPTVAARFSPGVYPEPVLVAGVLTSRWRAHA